MSVKINGLGVFNPFSKEFKQAQKVFYEDLSDRKRIIAVSAAVFGGLFFVVGGFAAFCWTVRALQPSKKQSLVSDNATKTLNKVQSVSNVIPVTNDKKNDYSDCYIMRGPRLREDYFEKFKEALKINGLNFKEYLNVDPGPGQRVIIFDYWGRPGGDQPVSPFKDDFQASVLYVILCPQDPIFSEASKIPLLLCRWNPDDLFNKLDGNGLKEFLDKNP